MKRCLITGLLACALAASQSPQKTPEQKADDVYTVGDGVTSPRLIHQVEPEHPRQGFRVTGTVLIGLIVNSKGEPDDVHVVRSLEKEIDQSAVDAVKQWRFQAATKDGKPVAVRISVEIRFHDM
jgi:protein TonB